MHVLFVGRDLTAVHYFSATEPRDNTVVVSFDYMRSDERLNLRPPYRTAIRACGYHQIHVFCSWDHWYQTPELSHLMHSVASQYAHRRLVFIGSSMGGFGALKAASLVDVDRVVALSPQCFIDARRDERFAAPWQQLQPEAVTSCDERTLVLFDPLNRLDKLQVQTLLRDGSKPTLVPMYLYGHWIDRAFKQRHALGELIQRALEPNFSAGNLRALARACRLSSQDYACNLQLAAEMRRRRPRLPSR